MLSADENLMLSFVIFDWSVFHFLPQGERGRPGDQGPRGDPGRHGSQGPPGNLSFQL